jgi:hypothetical protein
MESSLRKKYSKKLLYPTITVRKGIRPIDASTMNCARDGILFSRLLRAIAGFSSSSKSAAGRGVLFAADFAINRSRSWCFDRFQVRHAKRKWRSWLYLHGNSKKGIPHSTHSEPSSPKLSPCKDILCSRTVVVLQYIEGARSHNAPVHFIVVDL